MNYFKSRNIKKSKKNPKSRKHVWKRLLSMVLCAALILGIQPVPQPALAASTYTAAIKVATSDARYYYKDYVEFSETYKKTDFTSSSSPQRLSVTSNKLTFSTPSKPDAKKSMVAYVPFSIPVQVPAHTTRTFQMEFSVDMSLNANSSMNLAMELFKGDGPEQFSIVRSASAGENTVVHVYDFPKGCPLTVEETKKTGTCSVVFRNDGSSSAEEAAKFVLFCGIKNKFSAEQPQPTYNCELTGITYTDVTHTKTVSYDACGGSVSPTSKTVTYYGKYGELPTPTRTGYTFAGWYTAASGGSQITSDSTVEASSGDTLYAHWTGNPYSVTYDANGGGTPSQAGKTVTYGSAYGDLATVSRTGYTFAGWYTQKEGGTKVTSSTTVGTAENHTLYARWTANQYTITFSGAVDGSGSAGYTYKQTGTIPFPQAVDQTGSGKYFTGWKLTTSPTTKPTVDGTEVNTSVLYQPGQALALNGGALGNMTFTAQYTTLTGTSSTSEKLAIAGRSTISAPPEKSTYTVKVTGNDSLKALSIGGVTVTREEAEDFVLTAIGNSSKEVRIDGESAGSVAANGTLTVAYKTLTVTVNANKAVTLQGGPELMRSGPVDGVYTYTHTTRNSGSGTFPILVDGVDTGKTVRYGNQTVLTYHTATARVTAQPGAAVSSVELASGSKTLVMSADGSGQYSCTKLSDGATYTLRVNGAGVSGQTADFTADKTLNATIYAKTVTTRLDGALADIPGVDNVKIGGLDAARTGVGTWLATQVGTSIGNTVSINGESVDAAGGYVDYYTVVYDADGGENAPVDGNIYRKGSKAAALGQGEMRKDGCSFLGWKKDGTDVNVGEAVTINGKTTLTARWKEHAACEVKWQTPGGEPQYGTLAEALNAAGTTPDVTITVQEGRTANLFENHTLPESAKLIVPAGTKVVSDADGAVLDVDGRIENAGSFGASIGTLHIKESGKLINTGTVLWNIMPNVGRIENTGGTLGGDIENTDGGIVEGGTVTGTVTGGTVTGPLTNEGTIKETTVTGPVDLPSGGKIEDSVIDGTVTDKGGDLIYTEEKDGTGVVTPPGGSGTGSTPVQKLIDALGGAAIESPTGTVKLVADVDLTDNPIIISDDVIIDLNGHTITGPEEKPAIQIEGGDVTVKDSSDPDNGFIIGGGGSKEQPGAPGIENKGDGTVTVEGGHVSGGSGGVDGEGGAGIKNTGDGDVVIKGGEISGGSGGFGEPGGKGGSGIENTGNGKVNVEGGKVEGGSGGIGDNGGIGGTGVANTGDGTVDVSGGEVIGGTGGRTGSGDGGTGGKGIESDTDKVMIAPDASVSAGTGGVGENGEAALRNVTATIDTIPDQKYTSGEITPAVVVRDGADIIPASEYVVEYKDNIHAGTATVVVKDKPNKENALYKLADITTTFKIIGEPGKPTPAPGETSKPTAEPGTATAAPVETSKPTSKPTAEPGTATAAPVETLKPTAEPGTATTAPTPVSGEEKKKLSDKRKLELHSTLKAVQTGKKLQISWGRVTEADGYSVYVQYCRKDFNSKSLNQVKSGKKTKITVKKVNGRKLDTTKNFKLYVVAWKWKDGKKSTLAKTLTVHIAGKDSVKYTNVKNIKLKKTSYTLKKGGAVTLRPKAVLYDKHKKQLSVIHCNEFRYLSSNKKVATVTAGGKVKAKVPGSCTIYVFAKNGCRRKIKIKVKK